MMSYIPILSVDVIGSVCMVIFAFLSLGKAKSLRDLDPDNAVFLYLLWICMGLTCFAVSRSFGHILRQFLILTTNQDVWQTISPYTGTINTVSFMLVGSITLFFNQSWQINEKILSGQQKLEDTHIQLMELNQTLEHKVVERTEMLTSSEHKARRIFEHSLDTIIVTDPRFRVAEINKAGLSLTGYGKVQMLEEQMELRDFMAPGSEWDRIQLQLESNEFILNEEADFIRSDRTRVRVLITGGVDYGAFGCGKSFHFIIKDINEKKQMERQIAQADKMAALGELSAGVAHEINNPLGIILGYTQLMLKQPSAFDEDLRIIEKHVKNCKNVVSDLLSFSRKGSLEMHPMDVNQALEDVLKFLSNHSDFRNVEVKTRGIGSGPLMISGNEQELTQVFINLIINACHAVSKEGCIEVETGTGPENQVFIAIKDNGSGIKEEHFSRIFDPFFTTKPVGEGTGLGLSVGYGIIRRHGGDIIARNRKEEGAAFTITLPNPGAESNSEEETV